MIPKLNGLNCFYNFVQPFRGLRQKQLDKLIKLYDQQIDQITLEIQTLLSKDSILKNKVDQLCKIKGLGLLSVTTLVAETNGFEGFENLRQLVSFAGYDVVENQSGLRSGKIARRPQKSLKRVTRGRPLD
ncbi:IS110 family transposase [Dyadobacter flavalbus]|uniref:IS110 family transposase n=1 Tax=Dyadobacter flavalbus TaxID=2579942 RepID=A0A5M8QR63_9BACT|nr:transposase [Dyadobacter flavalbus]KAA6438757.1 IS110 family transposase [Dyadobacter flavalbus]